MGAEPRLRLRSGRAALAYHERVRPFTRAIVGRRLLAYAILAAIAFALIGGCGSILGLDDVSFRGAELDGSVGADGGTSSAGGEAGSVGEVGIAPCDSNAAPPAFGDAVYVSQNTGLDDGGTGAPTSAVKSIAAAVGLAKALGAKTIVLDEGTYAEKITLESLPNGITLDGAWTRTGAVWSRDCSANRALKTLVQSPEDVGVEVTGLGTRTVLSNLMIETRGPGGTPADTSGRSRIGVLSRNSILALENVLVKANDADPGGAATAGTNGNALCPSSLTCPDGPPGTTPPAAAGAIGQGTFNLTGFAPADGANGTEPGSNGGNGSPGSGGTTRHDCETGCDANTGCDSKMGDSASGAGRCGCGGQGGGPGKGARGGGASTALLAIGGTVSVRWSELAAGRGGDASAPGAGGLGHPGTPGVPGADGHCWNLGCCENGTCPGDCGCYGKGNDYRPPCTGTMPTDRPIPGGSQGGHGKPGGDGQRGGGASGGPSFSFVPFAGANVVVLDSKRTFGNGGNGTAGAPGGLTGEKP